MHRRARRRSASRPNSTRASCGASTTTTARRSSSWPTRSTARRTPSAGEDATTGWPRQLGGQAHQRHRLWQRHRATAARPRGRRALSRESGQSCARRLRHRHDRTSDVATVLVDELRAAGVRDRPGLRPALDEVPDEGWPTSPARASRCSSAPESCRPARLRLGTCEARISSRRNAVWLEATVAFAVAELLTKS